MFTVCLYTSKVKSIKWHGLGMSYVKDHLEKFDLEVNLSQGWYCVTPGPQHEALDLANNIANALKAYGCPDRQIIETESQGIKTWKPEIHFQ